MHLVHYAFDVSQGTTEQRREFVEEMNRISTVPWHGRYTGRVEFIIDADYFPNPSIPPWCTRLWKRG